MKLTYPKFLFLGVFVFLECVFCDYIIAQNKQLNTIYSGVIIVKDSTERVKQTKTADARKLTLEQLMDATTKTEVKFAATIASSGVLRPVDGQQFSPELQGIKKTANEMAAPNLTPYKPSTWGDKIVVSDATGALVDAPTLYNDETIYVNFAVINNGSAATSIRFYTALLLDGTEIARWYNDPPLNVNYYSYVKDYGVGTLTAGSHTFQIVADVTNAITETDESDNSYSKTLPVTQRSSSVNLTPYQPSTWGDKIVISNVTGALSDASTIYNDENIYVNWTVINNGSTATSTRFYTALLVDGTEAKRWYTDPPLNSNYYVYVKDYNFGTLTAGSHTFQIVADVTNVITETNESDNSYSKTKSFAQRATTVNLTPYKPGSWSDKIVVSDVTGALTDASLIYSDENVYVNWAVINNGTGATSTRFYTALLVDGTETARWYTDPPLNPNYYVYVNDYNLGKLSAGSHTFQVTADVTNVITESSESDNSYSKTKSVSARNPNPQIQVSPLSLTLNQSTSTVFNNKWVDYIPSKSNTDKQTTSNTKHPTGLVIPDSVANYWQNHTSRILDKNVNLLSSIDWSSNDSPVKDQKTCGSCWAFAALALVENIGHQSDLSEQVAISCSSGGGSCNGGWYSDVLEYFKTTGIPPEDCYPYTSTNGNCSNKCTQPAYLVKIKSYSPNGGLWGMPATVNQIKTALQSGPIAVTMVVYDDFYAYTSGIYHHTSGAKSGNHAVLLVGYNDDQQCFKVKNSWGSNWGEAGYFRISYSDVTNSVNFGSYGTSASDVFIAGQSNSITIENTGGSALTVSSITSNKSWLSSAGYPIVPFSIISNGTQSVTINVDWTILQSAQDTGSLTIASNDPTKPTVTVSVTVIKSTGNPILTVNTDKINIGSASGTSSINVSNTGAGNLTYSSSVTTGSDWLSITSGSTGINAGTINLSYSQNKTSSVRTGVVTITATGASGSPKTVQVTQAIDAAAASLKPVPASSSITKGTDFWVDVKVGDPITISDLYGISFSLSSSNALCTYVDGSATTGDFLGSSPLFFPKMTNSKTVDVAISKTSTPGVSGSGIIARVKFTSPSSITSDQTVVFSISNIVANNSTGGTISISPIAATITITGPTTVNVWPGDCNNDGVVNAADLLPIGQYYGLQNSNSNNPGSQWLQYQRSPWTADNGTPKQIFADANGDGAINVSDILVIGANYGKTHSAVSEGVNKSNKLDKTGEYANANLSLSGPSKIKNNINFTMQVVVGDKISIADLFGLSFRIKSNSITCSFIDNSSQEGSFLGIDILKYFQKVDNQTIDAAITKTSGSGVSGSGLIAKFDFSASVDQTVSFSLSNISATNSQGNTIALDASSANVLVGIDKLDEIPTAFKIDQNFPNPFNPSTAIRYSVPESEFVSLIVYDALGREVARLVNEEKAPGNYEARFDGTNLSSGLYFYRIQAGDFVQTKKMTLIK